MSSVMHMDASYSRMNSGGGPMFSNNVGEITNSGSGNVTVNNYSRSTKPKRTPAPRCPLASPNFIGRTEELDYMSHFFFGEGVLFDQVRILAVIGMGGCGKTQLVRKFMERVYRKFKDKPWLVFYADATTTSTLQASLAAIATANGYQDSSDAALAWMSRIDEPFFLYIDNADDHTINLRDYFPKSPHACIVITTRLRETKQLTTGRDSAIFLDPLSELEATNLLISTAGLDATASTVQNDVDQLIQELHCHPLAVVQAGAAIFKVQWTVRDYLKRFRTMRTGFMDGNADQVDSSLLDEYPSHVYSAWKLSYDRLSPSTAQLLGLCAHLHHTGITEDLFQRAYEGLSLSTTFHLRNPRIPFSAEELDTISFLDSFANESGWSADEFRRCIQEACSFSLVSYDVATRIYSIHPLIHDCLRSVAPHPSRTALLLSATMVPIEKDPVVSLALLPHVQRALGSWSDWRTANPPLHPVLANNMARILHFAGRWNEAEPLARAAVDGFGKLTHAGHPLTSVDHHDSATTGAENADAILALANLAWTLHQLGQFKEAEKIQKRVLEWRRRVLGMDHPDTISALNDLAATTKSLRQYEEAAKMQKQVLEWRRRMLGMDHPDTIWALSHLAWTMGSLRHHKEAANMQQQVLEWRRWVLGMDHPDTIWGLSNLATTLASLGRHEEAENLQKQVLVWRRRVFGMEHPDTLSALNNLARTKASLRQYEEAEKMQRQVFELRRRVLGMDHPDTIWALNNLAQTTTSLRQYEGAERMQKKVYDLRRRVLGMEHPDTIWALSNLASTTALLGPGHHAEAEKLQKQVVEWRQRVLGMDHPETVRAMSQLGWIVQSSLVRRQDELAPLDDVDVSSTTTESGFMARPALAPTPERSSSSSDLPQGAGTKFASIRPPTKPQRSQQRKARLVDKILAPFRPRRSQSPQALTPPGT